MTLPLDGRPTLPHTPHHPTPTPDPATSATDPAGADPAGADQDSADLDSADLAVPGVHLPPGLRPRVDLLAVATRYRAITATDTTEDMRRAALASALDVPRLVAEVDRLTRALVRSRLRYANLAAAARATLAATRDGDPDPAGYLRDELTHPTPTEPRPARPPSTGPGGGRRPHRVDPRSGRSAADRPAADRAAGDRSRR